MHPPHVIVDVDPRKPFEAQLRTFTNHVKASGVLADYRRRLHFTSATELRREAEHKGIAKARKRAAGRP